ncbi:hypothetical protein FF1_035419 [Malus domestica]
MDHSLSPLSTLKLCITPAFAPTRSAVQSLTANRFFRPLTVVAGAGASHCEFSSLNSPLDPRTRPGKDLCTVLQNHPRLFHLSVAQELKKLADDRELALSRASLSAASHEACLHRRIAQLKEQECETVVEDFMYLLVFYKFSEIKVHLVPKLSRCIYNGRLEIWPSKDWELESLYSMDVLEMIREHVSTVIGLRAKSSVTDNWAMTKITRQTLGQAYVASILYGYFLKSASLRHSLDCILTLESQDLPLNHRTSLQFLEMCPNGNKNLLFGRIGNIQAKFQRSSRQEKTHGKLRCYVMGFEPDTLQRCAKLRSEVAVNLIKNHCCALFGDDESMGSPETDEVILTSYSSLKRLVLEAVAFGSFLWDTEECIGTQGFRTPLFGSAMEAPGFSTAARPQEVSAAEGAGLPSSGPSAHQALTQAAGIKLDGTGQLKNILITGASGGVGHYVVQLAKLGNTHVTATCGACNIDIVRSLGADEVLDYKTPDGTALKSSSDWKYDFVIHCASAGIPWSTFEQNLSANGKVIDLTCALQRPTFSKKQLVPMIINLKRENLEYLVELMKEGKLKTVIDSKHHLSKAEYAWARRTDGYANGKIIVEI